MLRRLNPPTVAPPFSRYSQAVEAPGSWRWLYVSGQVGVDRDGKLAEGFAAQAAQTFANLRAVVEAAGMGMHDLVKVTACITRRSDLLDYRAARDAALGDAAPASTLLIVAGLANADWLIEVEAVAAAPE
jgi:enamine deaminase RidA (YjgF/YER057c/UK114 family)